MDKETVIGAVMTLKEFCSEQDTCENCPLRTLICCDGYATTYPAEWETNGDTLNFTKKTGKNKPCPICGNTELDLWTNEFGLSYICCPRCGTMGPHGATPERAREHWNTQAKTKEETAVIKSCPFCGSQAKIEPIMQQDGSYANAYNIFCTNTENCGVVMFGDNDVKQLKVQWNRRAE